MTELADLPWWRGFAVAAQAAADDFAAAMAKVARIFAMEPVDGEELRSRLRRLDPLATADIVAGPLPAAERHARYATQETR